MSVSSEIWMQQTWATVCCTCTRIMGVPHECHPDTPTANIAASPARLSQKPVAAPLTPKDDVGSNFQFITIATAYARHGGVLRADEVAEQMRSQWDQPVSILANWIVSRALITIDWHDDILIPMFQIESHSRGLRPGCREVIAELKDVMDSWEMARWFVTSDPWLGGQAPVDMLASSWQEVFHAARAARFITRG